MTDHVPAPPTVDPLAPEKSEFQRVVCVLHYADGRTGIHVTDARVLGQHILLRVGEAVFSHRGDTELAINGRPPRFCRLYRECAPPEADDDRAIVAATTATTPTPAAAALIAISPAPEPRESMFDSGRRHVCSYLLTSILALDLRLRIVRAVDLGNGILLSLDPLLHRLRAATDDDSEVDPEKVRRIVEAEIARARESVSAGGALAFLFPDPTTPVAGSSATPAIPSLAMLASDLAKAKARR